MTEPTPAAVDPGAARVHERLAAAEADRVEHARLSRRARQLTALVEDAELDARSERAVLAAQTDELHQLESLSPTRIWAALRGTHATELERERAEQAAQEYAAATAEAKLAALKAELATVEQSRDALGDVDAGYSRALAAKEAWAVASGQGPAAELAETAAALGAARAAAQEVQEAVLAADRALGALGHALSSLGSARSWSTYDTWFGGGLITDMVKYDRIDTAEQHMRGADAALKALSRELADVGMTGVGGVEVTELTRLFDVWFDNIFSDWSVRNRITDAADRLSRARGPVSEVRRALLERSADLEAEIGRLDRRRDELLARV